MIVARYEWLDNVKLKELLTRSFNEFNVKDPEIQRSILQKYSTAVSQNQAASLEIFKGKKLVASAMTVHRYFYSNCGPLKLSFLTQVIVQEEFRGQGHLEKLVILARDADEKNGSLGSIVIARRKVGNLYEKYGYRGFGVFPTVVVATKQPNEIYMPSTFHDWDLIATAYESCYKLLPGSLLRSRKYWQFLKSEIEKGSYLLGTIKSGKEFGYFISKEEKCLELAATNSEIFRNLISMCLVQGIEIFKIGSNHPAFDSLISAGGKYSTRPEFHEGHMVKLYRDGQFIGDYLEGVRDKFRGEMNPKERFSIDINLLNEW